MISQDLSDFYKPVTRVEKIMNDILFSDQDFNRLDTNNLIIRKNYNQFDKFTPF